MARLGKRKANKFLSVYSKSGRMMASCKAAGVSHTAVYAERDDNPEFQKQMAEAKLRSCDPVEDKLMAHLMDGKVKIKYKFDKAGNVVERTVEREETPELLLRWLQNRHPDYVPKSDVNFTGKTGVLVVESPMSHDEWQERYPIGDDEEAPAFH